MKYLQSINCKAMMGEYLLYYNNVLFGGIYDSRLLVKVVSSNKNIKEPSISVLVLLAKALEVNVEELYIVHW